MAGVWSILKVMLFQLSVLGKYCWSDVCPTNSEFNYGYGELLCSVNLKPSPCVQLFNFLFFQIIQHDNLRHVRVSLHLLRTTDCADIWITIFIRTLNWKSIHFRIAHKYIDMLTTLWRTPCIMTQNYCLHPYPPCTPSKVFGYELHG